MIDAAQIGIGLIDESGKFLDANPAMLSQLGAPSKQALISKTIRDTGSYNNPEFREAVNNYIGDGRRSDHRSFRDYVLGKIPRRTCFHYPVGG